MKHLSCLSFMICTSEEPNRVEQKFLFLEAFQLVVEERMFKLDDFVLQPFMN